MTRTEPGFRRPHRRFRVGTTGWTAADLNDPHIERRWEAGRLEIVEGVLTRMSAAAEYDPAAALCRLTELIRAALLPSDDHPALPGPVDVIVGDRRVARVDALYLSPRDRYAQKRANALRGRGLCTTMAYGRILVPPTLIIESLSRGHEDHDRITKRKWYAEMGVPNYWMFSYFERSLECVVLEGGEYRVDASGKDDEEVRPCAFPGLIIPLATLWAE